MPDFVTVRFDRFTVRVNYARTRLRNTMHLPRLRIHTISYTFVLLIGRTESIGPKCLEWSHSGIIQTVETHTHKRDKVKLFTTSKHNQ